MGLFNLFKKTPTPTLEHPVFGTLTFMEIKRNPENKYFEGAGTFAPTNNEIEYFIPADISGPTQQQVDFYEKLQSNYPAISSKCSELIESEFRNWKEDFKINDFNSEFKLVAINIPEFKNDPIEWDMAFETEHDENHQFTVYFEGEEANRVGVDG